MIHGVADVVIAPHLVFLAMAMEAAIGAATGRKLYRFEAVLCDLSCSVGNFTLQGVLGLSAFLLYDTVSSRVSLFSFDTTSWSSWLAALLLIDLLGYWRHTRASPYRTAAPTPSIESAPHPRSQPHLGRSATPPPRTSRRAPSCQDCTGPGW